MPNNQRLEAAQEQVEANLRRIRVEQGWDANNRDGWGIRSTQILALLEYVVELEERLERLEAG